ncbi:FHA domain-containing protein [Fuerstiella marisgermanici]|uniref:FHA domain-containing protein n=1 Tax=Fuerstiella marisgermanici TaxID=1891926 RepID=A0A1P8WP47_9PLAN|nr:FHA domain-containing protein [Fuerstiella marisgermanici]APZ95829.1 hypothetical protein Fuma_05491 [Fuerstiella marisgermanici]
MPDPNRKTVVEKMSADNIRTTVIHPAADNSPAADGPRQTVLESAAAARRGNSRRTVVERAVTTDAVSADPVQRQPPVFRSVVRSPMAMLTAFDDGRTESGEVWRLRQSRTTIGRANCDIVIPHDPDISATHAEIVRCEQDGGHQWQLVDLNSTNGVFVRVNKLVLRNGRELWMGGRRYVFTCQDTIQEGSDAANGEPRGTLKQTAPRSGQLLKLGARLVEQTSGSHAREFSLKESKSLIGTDSSRCDICIADPFLNDVHAELFQDKQKRWVIRDQNSVNGVWVKAANKALDSGTEFLLGGQRFRFDTL